MNPYSNPYAPPQADVRGARAGDLPAGGDVPDVVVEPLRSTKPWVTFLAVVGFIVAGVMVLAGLGALASQIPSRLRVLGLLYLALAAAYVFLSLHLLHYGSAIARLVRDPRMERLVVALGHQRSFWKLAGILSAALLVLYPVGIVVFLLMR